MLSIYYVDNINRDVIGSFWDGYECRIMGYDNCSKEQSYKPETYDDCHLSVNVFIRPGEDQNETF